MTKVEREAHFFVNIKKKILEAYNTKSHDDFIEHCILSMIPIYVGCYFVLQDHEDEEITDTYERLLRFYRLD